MAADDVPLFDRSDITMSEAPVKNLLPLSPHPSPNVFASPARARYASLIEGRAMTDKRQKGQEAVGTLFSGVSPVLNVTWGSKDNVPGQHFISFIDTGKSYSLRL